MATVQLRQELGNPYHKEKSCPAEAAVRTSKVARAPTKTSALADTAKQVGFQGTQFAKAVGTL